MCNKHHKALKTSTLSRSEKGEGLKSYPKEELEEQHDQLVRQKKSKANKDDQKTKPVKTAATKVLSDPELSVSSWVSSMAWFC